MRAVNKGVFEMKKVRAFLLSSLLSMGVSIEAVAQSHPPFRIATSPIGESLVLYAARDLGWFKSLPFEVVVEATTTTDVSGLLGSGAINAHTFPSSAIPAMVHGRVCAQMVLPLSRGFAQSVIAKRSSWYELAHGTVAVYALPSVAASFVEEMARAQNVRIEQKAVRFFTADRVRRMLTDDALVATHAAHPHAAYAQYVQGLSVLSRPGDGPEAVHVGLFVRCDDVRHGSATEQVVRALRAFVAWSVEPAHTLHMVRWIESWLARGIHEKFSRNFEGLALTVPEIPIRAVAEYIYADYVRSVAVVWPTPRGEEETMRFALGDREKKVGQENLVRVFSPLFFQ
jgi:ABC-type nitrate/sulfonate/bicarbonate transport system substrate-binding protein